MGLPAEVVLPPEALLPSPLFRANWRYVRGTAAALPGVRIRIEPALRMPCWSAFEAVVDGRKIAIDMSDFLQLAPVSGGYELWLRFQHTPAFEPYERIGSFPPYSHEDWPEYERHARRIEYTAAGDRVCYRVHSHEGGGLPGRTRRRELVRGLLRQHFPGLVDEQLLRPYWRFLEAAAGSLVAVHVPGSDPHILDRSLMQLWSVGVCVISTDIWTTCLEHRPVPGEHYIMMRDDFSDLIELIHWCRANRPACRRIGQQAKEFFLRHCTPAAIWSYISRRLGQQH